MVFDFFDNHKDAILAIGVLLTFTASMLSLYFSVRNNKAVHYVNSVTKNRVEWIERFRSNIAKLITLTKTEDMLNYAPSVREISERSMDENINRVKEVATLLKLQLNFTDKMDRQLIEKIDNLELMYELICAKVVKKAFRDRQEWEEKFFVPDAELNELAEQKDELSREIVKDAQIYLKSEWNRVKYESRGKTYEKETQEFDILELQRKYEDPEYKSCEWKRDCINIKAKMIRLQVPIILFAAAVGAAVLVIVA